MQTEQALSKEQKRISKQLKDLFSIYLHRLSLQLDKKPTLQGNLLDEESLKDYLLCQLITSANRAIASGKDVSALKYLKIDDGKVVAIRWEGYLQALQR